MASKLVARVLPFRRAVRPPARFSLSQRAALTTGLQPATIDSMFKYNVYEGVQRCAHEHQVGKTVCSMGTGEVVHICSWEAAADRIEEFEHIIQKIAFNVYNMSTGITDVRVCHPTRGAVSFVITFVSRFDEERFIETVRPTLITALQPIAVGGTPSFSQSGTLMPQVHSMESLLTFLKKNVLAVHHSMHPVAAVRAEMAKWFPRRIEYEKYVTWNEEEPLKYTRNVVHSSPAMEVLVMCWPAGAKSSIHCHDESSCWVAALEGELHEVQYQMPRVDRKFMEAELASPTGAVGRCGPLKISQVAQLGLGGANETYANNQLGIHRIENRTENPAITLHVYSPRLSKMRIFADVGEVSVMTVAQVVNVGETDGIGKEQGLIDVNAWNDM